MAAPAANLPVSPAFTPLNDQSQHGPFQWSGNLTWAALFAYNRTDIQQFVIATLNDPRISTRNTGGTAGIEAAKAARDKFISMSAEIPEAGRRRPLDYRDPTIMTTGERGAGELDAIWLQINKTQVPHFSVYDILGWAMSKAVGVVPRSATTENFYLPLITLYAHWCAAVRLPFNLNIAMVSISWFGEALILGATIPDEPLKATVQRAKLEDLNKKSAGTGSGAKTRTNYPQLNEEGAGQQFGHCAETNQYLLYGYANRTVVATARGLAMQPPENQNITLTPYNARIACGRLRDPCTNCQYLIARLLKKQNVLAQFGITETIKKLDPPHQGPMIRS